MLKFLSSTFTLFLFISLSFAQQKVWLDADTGNEMDDLYAIAHLVKSDKIDLIGISSAHFNNADLNVFEKWNAYETATLKPVEESQRLNEEILAAMGRMDIPHPLGADRQIGRAWGQQDPRDSPAAQAIIAEARKMKGEEKLHVLTLGAMTNVATALILAPDIKDKIQLFSLGSWYSPETGAWNKSEFNIRCDLNAFDYLLNLEGLDFTIMTTTTSFALQFDRDETYDRLDESVEIEKILEDRWRIQNPQDKTRVMWDLALVEAYLYPEWATISEVTTPPENTQRKVKVYTEIDAEAMKNEFWRIIKE
ncbi:nucleoside hydrolase [Algoriphagus sediminis]|uniref:Nucleoside hydrolase n=1 Tax=Algoriphagus sediminis TaxID=3057113 RepID=A0ABT7YFM3_9BACT|nr:nucleoside hydrolase [Algoriphagus sediminis]MDN3205326.1 nucleoside hydrolase [Algoriphagus sediminis]